MNGKLFIQELGQVLGINDLELDAGNSCSFVCEESIITIQYQVQSESFLIYSPICAHDESNDYPLHLYKACLEANLFAYGTAGLHLGYLKSAGAIVLSGVKDNAALTQEDMLNFLNFFAEELGKWKVKLSKVAETSTESSLEFDDAELLNLSNLSNNFIRV